MIQQESLPHPQRYCNHSHCFRAEAHQRGDPKNTAAGIISEKTGSIAASTVVVAAAAVIAASAVCSS